MKTVERSRTRYDMSLLALHYAIRGENRKAEQIRRRLRAMSEMARTSAGGELTPA